MTDPHLAGRMLAAHLDPAVDLSTYRASFVTRALTWLTEKFQVRPGVRVADLGCGPGLYATPLARTGARVTGIDLSEGSLAYARREAAREGTPVRYVQGDYLEWGDAAAEDGERYDLVLLVMRDYCALAPHQRARLLAAVRERLAPGGSFVLDVDAVAAFAEVEEGCAYAPGLMDGFWSPEPYVGFRHTLRYAEDEVPGGGPVSLDKYDILTADRHRVFCNWVRHFTPETLAAELTAAGLTLREAYGDLAGAPYAPDGPHFAGVAGRG
ncbi:SAM-dependent methyltransferase [Streptomyces albidoflavus]|uniref:SAM-dependent methyltransferase n=1 Tax=Streptomyces albidoflavus TaxID=1886 RepID=UPI000A990A97|nr:class I SAM-dependent methyltransferase [Streptomyces albidoflavus]